MIKYNCKQDDAFCVFTIVNNRMFTFVSYIKYNMIKYQEIKEENLKGRYIDITQIEALHDKHLPYIKIETVGFSVEKKPIYTYTFGSGEKRILLWSQMHGNETTTTKAVFDFLNCLHLDNQEISKLLDACTFCIIPILNPDGATYYTRLNANLIDLNRDAQKRTQPESSVLRMVYDEYKPHYCLNLHGQRTIFSTGYSANSSVLSFLSPAEDEQRAVTETRKKAMEVVACIANALQDELPSQISRYNDAFNINCVGDTFQSLHTPTILFEAGHYPEDYDREKTRKYLFKALMEAFNAIAFTTNLGENYQPYFKLPENKKLFFDVIIRNVKKQYHEIIDVAIQYDEVLMNGEVKFIPKLAKTGDLTEFFGHKELDAQNGEVVINENTKIPKLLSIIKKISINNEDVLRKLLV